MRKKFELPSDLTNFAESAIQRTAVYLDVRYFAQSLVDNASVFYGAITTCVLPVLYALLGTCAYLLRTFEQQMSARTFTPSVANSARFLIAAIGGAVVGLFNNFNIIGGSLAAPQLRKREENMRHVNAWTILIFSCAVSSAASSIKCEDPCEE
jgi:hypothetical protein